MLIYRLTGTTDRTGSTTTNTASVSPTTTPPQRSNGTESSPTMVRLEDGAALLICDAITMASTRVALAPKAIFHSDYAEVDVKPRSRGVACA